MIPKTIHYIWFGGGAYNERIKACIDSWHRYLPGYKFRLWNEETFDVAKSCRFVREAYEQKKWAFVSDYVRLYALYHEGGIYLDTDIEVVKPFSDDLLRHKAFIALDDGGYLSAAAAEAGLPFYGELMRDYEQMSFVNDDGSLNMEVNNTYMQDKLVECGYVRKNEYQELSNGIVLYPDDYFHCRSLTTGKLHKTEHTYAIHWHTITWVTKKTRIINYLRINVLVPLLGEKLYNKLTHSIKGDATTF